MAQYMLLLYDNPTGWTKLSPEEMKMWIGKYQAFRQKLVDRNQYVSSHKLADDPGRVMRGSGSQMKATDGPYSETKEWLGGFFLVEAPNYKAAVEIARDCPS
ncbi:MAG TPA: YciI family protein, partial [Terriglobales bacterium]|nr:YciI family protein [Terriglobales bacterium]